MKIALVGIGKIAVDEHVPAISDSPDWELAATVSREGAVDGVEAFTDLGAMLEARPDIRVVSLCLPPVPRFAYAMQAIAAGRHIMLEKPPGATLAECHALERAEASVGVPGGGFAEWGPGDMSLSFNVTRSGVMPKVLVDARARVFAKSIGDICHGPGRTRRAASVQLRAASGRERMPTRRFEHSVINGETHSWRRFAPMSRPSTPW